MLPSVRSENPSDNAHLYRLKTKGSFQIWSKETLIKHGFNPETSPYYAVFLFDNTNEIIFPKIDIKNGAVLTGSSINIKLLIILITKAHDWVLKLTFANIVFLFVKSIRHLFFNTNLTYQPNSFCTSKQGQALAANSLWPWTVARGISSCSCSTRARSEAFCAAVRVSLGLPSVDRPPT